jgi:hypothetical protein
MPTTTQLAAGLAGAIGSDFRSNFNQLVFVEYGGKLSRIDLFPLTTVVSQGTAVLKGTFHFDLDNGTEALPGAATPPGSDIWWEQSTAVVRMMAPSNGAKLINLGVVNFATLSPTALLQLPYSTAPIPGNNDATNKLVTGDVFAVHTNGGNYAKVKVVDYGYNMVIQWETYKAESGYAVLGTGYNSPEDVKASTDGAHVYVTERSGDLLRVALANANRSSAAVVSSGITAPQQMFLDESVNAAFVVEYAASGRLLRIDLTTGHQTVLLSGLNNAVGLVLSADLQSAFVSEQTTGPNQGTVSQIQLSNGQRTLLAKGLTSPFMLTWTDPSQTTLLVAERDPANRITSINVSAKTTQLVASVPFRPSSVAVVNPALYLVCSDQVVDELTLSNATQQPNGPLLESIGYVPFDWLTPGFLADTSVDPSYFFQAVKVPFAGTLPLMINQLRASLDGASFYQVKVDGAVRTDVFNGAKWNGTEYVGATLATVSVNGQPGFYPVQSVADMMLWIQPLPGCYLDTTNLASATTHKFTVDFYKADGSYLESATPLTLYIDNNPCKASISMPTLNGVSATNNCGYLQYNAATATTDKVTIAYNASQPEGFATYSFSLIKGISGVPLALPTNVAVGTTPPPPITDTVAGLLGGCTIAGFAASVYVAASATNGWGRQSQYDAPASVAFVLAP